MKTQTAIILAAGFGSRLQPEEGHKLLARLGGRPLLLWHLEGFKRLGVQEIVVVGGHDFEALEEAIAGLELGEELTLRTVFNPDFDGPNGLSVLCGAATLKEGTPFWLTMSDHLFDPALFEHLAGHFFQEKPAHWQGALLVDYKLATIFDMPDATKVRTDPKRFAISKELDDFDAVDTGLFWCGPGFVQALQTVRRETGGGSTSDAVKRLQAQQAFGFYDVGDFLWQDVDTPGAREHAEGLVKGWGGRRVRGR